MATSPELEAGTNTFTSLEDADIFFTERPEADLWDAYTDNEKARALVTAFRGMNKLRYAGVRTESDQVGAWPRVGMEDEEGTPLAEDEVPEFVMHAQCLEALARLQSSGGQSSQRSQLQAQGVTKFILGDLSETYDLSKTRSKHVISPEAFLLLKPYLMTAGPMEATWPFERRWR